MQTPPRWEEKACVCVEGRCREFRGSRGSRGGNSFALASSQSCDLLAVDAGYCVKYNHAVLLQ